jgi:hypothetical protein
MLNCSVCDKPTQLRGIGKPVSVKCDAAGSEIPERTATAVALLSRSTPAWSKIRMGMDKDTYKQGQDLFFQEMEAAEALRTKRIMEGFVRAAAERGYTIDDLLKLLESTESPRQFAEVVLRGPGAHA